MIESYNKALDDAQKWIEDMNKTKDVQYFKDRISNSYPVVKVFGFLEENESTKDFFRVIKNANNFKAPQIKIEEKVHVLDYQKRRNFVLYTTTALLVLFGFRKFHRTLFSYVFLSSLCCRENFNLRNYKIDFNQ
jgi:hypothetical protein